MARAPKFADPEHPARVGYTKLTMPVDFSPRAVSRNNGKGPKPEKPLKVGNPKRSPIDKLAALPGRRAAAKDILRGTGNRRVKY